MKVLNSKQIKKLDDLSARKFGISTLILMENAGRGIAELAHHMLKGNKSKKVLVICGKGNNGGDGFVAARHLSNKGYSVRIILIGKSGDLKNDPKINFQIIQKMNVPILELTGSNKISRFKTGLKKSDLVIDALFGIGLDRPVEGLFREVISLINAVRVPVLSIDIPSGLNSDSGQIMGIALRAKVTGTLAVLKPGLLRKNGPKQAGKVEILDISIPQSLLQ